MQPPATPANETERLAALYELQILDTPPESRFDEVVQLASQVLKTPMAFVSLIDSKRQWFKSRCGLDLTETTRDTSLCGHAILEDTPLILPDARLDPRFTDNPYVAPAGGIRFYAGHPIQTIDGYKVGTFCIADRQPRTLSAEEERLFRGFARIIEDQLRLVDAVHVQKQLRNLKADLEVANEDLQRRNAFIREVFGVHMTAPVADLLLDSPDAVKLGGDLQHTVIMICDMRGFTAITQQLQPDGVVQLLNRFLGLIIENVEACGGMVDQILGDGVLALFGVPAPIPDPEVCAVRCAVRIQEALAGLNASNAASGFPAVSMGIGINAGEVVVGNIGSSSRMKYSVVGDAVNIAARIESLTLPGQILVSDSIRQRTGAKLRIGGHMRMKVKGVESGVTVYEVAGLAD